MAIKAVITAEEHAKLDAALQGLYKQEGTAFVLDADGIDAHPATRSLKNALEAERTGRGTAARELQELKDKLGDMTAEEAVEARKKIREIEDAQRVGDIPEKFKEKFESAVAARVEQIQRNHEAKIKGYEKQVSDLTEKLTGANGQLETLTIDHAVRDAAAKKGVQEQFVEDAIMHARQVFKLVDGKPTPMRNGQPIYSGKKPGDPMPIDEWLETKTAEKPGWLKPNGGAGADHQRQGGGTSRFVITREQARDPKIYERVDAEARKAGAQLEIAD